ncbi:hypothetical protein [Streptomyces sp. NPDC053069]|uniref:hypothetical protein n=1 Tax=Streptomyces sp. NPDC053069 TaxID=3365695 RepID=UPI0037CDC1CE
MATAAALSIAAAGLMGLGAGTAGATGRNVSYAAMFPTEASQSDDGPTVQVNG